VGVVGSSVVASVSWVRGVWNRARRAPGFVVFGIGLVGHAFGRWRFLMDWSVLPRCLESPVIVVSVICCEWRDSER
jgi:hypothetical protein